MKTKKQLKFDVIFYRTLTYIFAALSLMCAFEILDLHDKLSVFVGGALWPI